VNTGKLLIRLSVNVLQLEFGVVSGMKDDRENAQRSQNKRREGRIEFSIALLGPVPTAKP
jgi:hypothetical protein